MFGRAPNGRRCGTKGRESFALAVIGLGRLGAVEDGHGSPAGPNAQSLAICMGAALWFQTRSRKVRANGRGPYSSSMSQAWHWSHVHQVATRARGAMDTGATITSTVRRTTLETSYGTAVVNVSWLVAQASRTYPSKNGEATGGRNTRTTSDLLHDLASAMPAVRAIEYSLIWQGFLPSSADNCLHGILAMLADVPQKMSCLTVVLSTATDLQHGVHSENQGWKNRALVGLDWLRGEIFGRDTSRIT